MLLSGFHPLTLLDYPEKTACIVFTVGCDFRCGFCHNPNFVLPERIAKLEKSSFVNEEKFFQFLEKRVGLLDGVVICWGEPTLQHDLETFIRKIRALGFLVKLDTNGSNPEALEKLLFPTEWQSLLEMVAMDIKRPLDDYGSFPLAKGTDEDLPSRIRKSMELLGKSGIRVEFRTTVIKGKYTGDAIENIIKEVSDFQKKYCTTVNYAIQNFRSGDTLLPNYDGKAFSKEELEEFRKIGEKYSVKTMVRE